MSKKLVALSLGFGSAITNAVGWQRKLLLVIDNCEHVINAAATVVEAVVRLCPMVSVVATSRELPRIDGDCTYRLPPLDFPEQNIPETDHDRILEKSAIQLFVARATMWHSRRPSQSELTAISAICRHLDVIPLAIEFAAARAAMLGVEEVLSRLDNRFALLTSGRRTALPKHRTLRATLDWSYELLSGSERQLLQRLAIFAAAFSLQAASFVTGSDAITTPDISEDIADLVAKSLVASDTAETPARFRLLETARVYAFEKLTEGDEAQRIARRHVEYYSGMLQEIDDQRETRPASLADLANVRTALEWCFSNDGDTKIGIGLATSAAPVFLVRAAQRLLATLGATG